MKKRNWKTTTMLVGTLAGALVGAAAAYMMIKNGEREDVAPKITPQQGLQVGLGLLGLLKLISGVDSKA